MTYSIRDIAEQYGVGLHTVLAWVRSGDLRAINVGRRMGAGKPRWRITQEALEAFTQLRAATQPQPKAPRRRRPADVIEFYK
jgi:excisionase family DNA binding protein